jgi:hypothetical protein
MEWTVRECLGRDVSEKITRKRDGSITHPCTRASYTRPQERERGLWERKFRATTRADAAIFYDAELLRVELNSKNLFDEDYFEGSQFRESILPGAPFTVLGSIEVKF